MKFACFDTAAFLRDTWQQRPLLIRNPWDAWENPLEPDELAGLACEEGVESRLITWAGDTPTLENGPLPESRFAELAGIVHTLLVQAVDQHAESVAALIEPFRFVPDWRIDDVMVSYAVDGGGVGPHFDQYDVFLVQGLGQRRWRVGGRCDADTPLRANTDLRLLADFAAVEEYVLDPGDILYIPPGFAHDGVAVGDDCMTFSVGFRAPSRGELVNGWAQECAEALAEDDRFADPGLAPQANPGEITAEGLERLQAMALEALASRAGFARWFGEHSTTPKYPEIDWRPEQPLTFAQAQDLLACGTALCRNPASRFAFVAADDGVVLFADGNSFDCAGADARFAEDLCAAREGLVPPAGVSATLVVALVNQGSIAFADEE